MRAANIVLGSVGIGKTIIAQGAVMSHTASSGLSSASTRCREPCLDASAPVRLVAGADRNRPQLTSRCDLRRREPRHGCCKLEVRKFTGIPLLPGVRAR